MRLETRAKPHFSNEGDVMNLALVDHHRQTNHIVRQRVARIRQCFIPLRGTPPTKCGAVFVLATLSLTSPAVAGSSRPSAATARWVINKAQRSTVDCPSILQANSASLRRLSTLPFPSISRRNFVNLKAMSSSELRAAIEQAGARARIKEMQGCVEGAWLCQGFHTTFKDIRLSSQRATIVAWREKSGSDHGIAYAFDNDEQSFPGPIFGLVTFRGRSIVVTETGGQNILLSSVEGDGMKSFLSVECAARWER